MDSFVVKDSGVREEYASGMVRDTQEGKIGYHRVLDGPMFARWASHLSKGAAKYPDNEDGTPNWTLANSDAELRRFKQSAFRHFIQWLNGDRDEDHAAAVFFNVNAVEYLTDKKDAWLRDWEDDGFLQFLNKSDAELAS